MAGDPEDAAHQQALMMKLQDMKNEANGIAQKISELDQERHEHSLVLETLTTLDTSRKCFRMVGTVLTERTVGEVRPAVEENMKKLEEVVSDLTKKLHEKEKEMMAFQAKHNIRTVKDKQNTS